MEWIRLKFISSPRSPCPITALATLEKGVLVRLTRPCCCRGSHGSNRYPPLPPLGISPFSLHFCWSGGKLASWGDQNLILEALSLEFVGASVYAQACLTLCDPMDYIAHQTPLSLGFSRHEYSSGLLFPLLQGIFLTQGLNPHVLHWQADSLPLSHQGSPLFVDASPFIVKTRHENTMRCPVVNIFFPDCVS